MSRSRRHLRVANADESSPQEKIPWKTIALTSAVGSIAAFGAVEFVRFLLSKAKEARSSKQAEAAATQAQAAALANPGGMQALPGAVHPSMMFQSPYSQMAMMRGLPGMQGMQGMPGAPPSFQNPLVTTNEGEDEPPKWFREFKSEHDKRLTQMEARFTPPRPAAAEEPHLSAVEEDVDYYEEDETG